MSFRTIEVYTVGIDWYQINGKLLIKGVDRDVKFFATGIRGGNEIAPTLLVVEGQLDLLDWGIDYDKIVNGELNTTPTKKMHFNMRIEMD